MRRDVFQAIADPTRREIIDLISRKSLNLNAIADKFDISRPAVSQHMKILIECGLVTVEAVGRERFCRARLEGLKKIHSWTEQYRIFWTRKLDALGIFLDNENRALTKRKKINKKNPPKK
jgi:DNA-binding transcriptional ArsR family regulator